MGPWAAFKQFIFWCIKSMYLWCGDWGLAIILITIIIRLLLFPITNKQFKSSYQMQKLQPKIKAIQEQYAGDQQKIQQETQIIYRENKYNPLMGCLPMVVQMPVFIALFQVLRELETYIASAGLPAEAMDFRFYNLINDLSLTPREVWGTGWVNIIPYVILILIFTCTFFIPMLINGQKPEKTTLITTVLMSVMMLWVSLQSPGGVLLYWDMSSIFGVVQQLIQQAIWKNKDKKHEEEIEQIQEVRPVNISVARREKKPRPKKSR